MPQSEGQASHQTDENKKTQWQSPLTPAVLSWLRTERGDHRLAELLSKMRSGTFKNIFEGILFIKHH